MALKVHLKSFSYKEAIPNAVDDNGGGFVFDVRCLNNPGRQEKYKHQTGLDDEVIEFLLKEDDVHNYERSVQELVTIAIENYLTRNFTSLSVFFGCTGGQHRSVFFTERTAAFVKEKLSIEVEIEHIQLKKKGFL